MPARSIVANKIAEILGVMAHPHRIRLIEELAIASKDVQSLEKVMQIPQSTVSQHLSQLKGIGLVQGTRVGKRVVYSLTRTWVAAWLLEAIRLIDEDSQESKELKQAVAKVKKIWVRVPYGE